MSFQLPARSHIGYVHLNVTDFERSVQYYEKNIGFDLLDHDSETASLGVDHQPLILLTRVRDVKSRSTNFTGLFHLAIRVPDRTELARALKRLVALGQRFQGFADHGVSEAIYLTDPEGNGIEIYRDRPKEEWPYENGQLQMVTDPLDVNALLEVGGDVKNTMPPGTDMGHVHLQVSELKKARHFYHEIFDLDITQESYHGALFMSAGGYHHHIGANIWNSQGAPPIPAESPGLRSFNLIIPGAEDLRLLAEHLSKLEIEAVSDQEKMTVRDEDRILLEVTWEK